MSLLLYYVSIEMDHMFIVYWLFVVHCVKHWENRYKSTVLDNLNNIVDLKSFI